VDADLFVSEESDVSARLEVEYPILLTQRLILQPSFELDFAVQEMEELRVGPGLSQVELGVRLRYEILRELAPYIGFVWERKVGQTADLVKAVGEEVDTQHSLPVCGSGSNSEKRAFHSAVHFLRSGPT
jgi:copper resistance protein B